MKTLELGQLTSELPTRVNLNYVDYRDDLDEQAEELQKCIHANNWEAMDEVLDGNWEQEHDAIQEVLKELKSDIKAKYDLKGKTAKRIIEEYEDELRDEIYNRDDSNLLKDLLSNTDRFICFYDTGYEMDSDSWSWTDKEVEKERQRIKKVLKVRGNDKYNDRIEIMIRQASYGGTLVVYFRIDVGELIGIEASTIEFKDPAIAVINNANGSGDSTDLDGHSFKLPYNRENVFIDKTVKYNYTYDVCGMCEDWCDATEVILTTKAIKGTIERSEINELLDKEIELNATFKNGKCTFGDMDIKRHRNTSYINDFPCGTKCADCGTFWID